MLVVGDFFELPPGNQKSLFTNQVRGHLGHSTDPCGKHSNCLSWLRLSDRAVIRSLLNYLIEFELVSKQIMIWFK